MNLFDFNPTKKTVKIKLAFAYTPKVFHNHIKNRKNPGLLYILSGKYCYFYGNSSFSAGANSLIYLPANSVPYEYQISEVDGQPVRAMQIELDLLNPSDNESMVYSMHPTLLTKHATSEVSDCFEKIISEHMKTNPASIFMTYSRIFWLLALCAEYAGDSQIIGACHKITPAIEYIQDNYKRVFSVSELANICHISESQLRRIFLSEIGMSPISYKNHLLLKEACRLLSNAKLSIGEISQILGFCDIYAFSHFFSKYKGVSPTAYKSKKEEE